MNTKQLRQKILDLAIRGKLIDGQQTQEWASVKLGDIAQAVDPQPSHRTPPIYEDGIPYIGVTECNYETETIDFNAARKVGHGVLEEHINRYTLTEGDFIIGKIGTIGKPFFVPLPQNYTLSANIVLIQPTQKLVNAKYLFYQFSSTLVENQFRKDSRATTQAAFGIQKVRNIDVLLPPLAEQHRIVAAIESAFAVIDEIERNKADLQAAVAAAKQKILSLAIRGKLVPQDPNDETVRMLLERIGVEKERLIKERKIKPHKSITVVDKTQYGDLPRQWMTVPIGEVFIINPRNVADDEVISSFVPMTLIDDGFSNKFTFHNRPWGEIKSGFTHFQDNDVGLAKITPCLENRKSVVFRELTNGIGAGTTELHIFRPIIADSILPHYLLWFFKNEQFILSCVGAFSGAVGQRRVGKDHVAETLLPIPPFAEQRRIVAAIEAAFEQLDRIEDELQ